MYVGIYPVRLRAKNRLAFPARLRKQTNDSFLITNWFENTLMILPKAEWESLVSDLFREKSYLQAEVRDLDRFIFGGTFELDLDLEGRFVLPGYLKKHAKIENEVVFVGGMWYIQLWDRAMFENYREVNSMQMREKAKNLLKAKEYGK